MTPDQIQAHKDRIESAVAALRKLSQEERKEVLQKFCRDCLTPIPFGDWSGRNFCVMCSPGPLE
jgi:hypothetical protein